MIDNFALIIGAMKCGTTSLFNYLSQHPEVAPATPKEPHFFTRALDAGKNLDWYRERWDWDERTHRIALEASTSYTRIPRFPNTAERIARVRADFRFLYVLRDPIERIESTLAHQIVQGRWRDAEARKGEIPYDWIEMSMYAMQIREYYKRFSADRILLLDFLELKERPAEMMVRVCRFLDIAPSFPFKDLDVAHNVSRRDHPVYVAMSRSGLARAATRFIPTRLRHKIRTRLSTVLEIDPTLSKSQRLFAQRELANDVEQLRDEFGFDTSRWCHYSDP